MKYTIEAWVNKTTLEKHCLVLGGTGSGKTQLLRGIGHSLIVNSNKKRDCSVVVIEPHADLATSLMATRALDNDRLIYISSTIQREAGCHEKITPAFNPFLLPEGADEAFKSTLATQLTSAIIEMVETSQFGITINMEMILRPVVLVTLSSPNPSLETVKKFLTRGENEQLVQLGMNYPHPQIQSFFTHSFNAKHFEMTKAALVGKINWFLNDIDTYNMLTSKGIDLEKCLDTGKVIIVNTPRGANPFIATLVGRLLIAYLFAIILRREAKPANKRLPVYLLVDEFAHYLTSSLTQSLHEARKYKLALILSGQTLKGLPVPIRTAITTNVFLKCLSITDAETRSQFAREMGISTKELVENLTPMKFLVSKNDGNASKPFRIGVKILSKHLFLREDDVKKRLAYLIEHSGAYQPVPPPPPPAPPATPSPTETEKSQKAYTQKRDDNPFAGGNLHFK